jgi:hypothetical protein
MVACHTSNYAARALQIDYATWGRTPQYNVRGLRHFAPFAAESAARGWRAPCCDSCTEGGLMPNVFSRVRQLWRDKIAGPPLPTYDAACEELGGAPWRIKPDKTDRWFLVAQPDSGPVRRSTPPDPFPALDTGAIVLTRRMSERTKLLLVGGAALAVIVACLISLVRSAAPLPSSAVITTAPAAVAPASAPAAVTPSTARPLSPAATTTRQVSRASSSAHTASADESRVRLASAKRYAFARHRRR